MTPRFDSRDGGIDESDWRRSWPPLLGLIAPPGPGDSLLIVAAHPDDETMGAGGLIATAAQHGVPVTVLVLTDGEASHPRSPTHSPADLAAIRHREVTAAVAILHADARLHLAHMPDSDLSRHQAEVDRLVREQANGHNYIVTPWDGDRHPDHAACARAGARAAAGAGAQHWQYPIWAWHWGRPDSTELPRERMRRVSLAPEAVEAKRLAMRCHVSQHLPLSTQPGDEEILTGQMLEHFDRDYESYVVETTDASSYFDDQYAAARDPWGFAERFYEIRKRDLLLASLPRPRFKRAFEPGCAIGLLTEGLASRCDAVVAWDLAHDAVDQTRARVAASAVTVERREIPADWPAGRFDLIVVSEVGYYCADLSALARRIEASLTEDGVVVGCHWRHPALMHAQSAVAVHARIGAGLVCIAHHVEDDFVLDVWTRDGVSVAAAEGIVD